MTSALENVRRLPGGGLSGQFVHAIDPKHWMTLNNLMVDGRLRSVDFVGLIDPGLRETYRPLGDIPLDDLRSSAGLVGYALSPRTMSYIVPAAVWDRGQILVNGFDQEVPVTPSGKRRTIDFRDTEIEFERGRRQWAPLAPSRLSGIWLAEDSDAGRSVINGMFRGRLLVTCRVELCLSYVVADSHWFDEYCNRPDERHIERYWTGVRYSQPRPELLVEGMVQLVDHADIEQVRRLWLSTTSSNESTLRST